MMDWHVLVGDDDQTIYEFAGCTAEAFLNPPIADKYKKILSQSYRVPANVHKLAQFIIRRVSVREPKQYFPRRDENGNFINGSVSKFSATYRKIEYLVQEIQNRLSAGKTVMFLTTCAYMIDPLKAELVNRGIPFENEFRRRRSDWNPLHDDKKGVSAKRLLNAFLDSGEDGGFWTVEQFITWAKFLSVGEFGLVKKVGKKAIEVLEQAVHENKPGIHSARNVIEQIISPAGIKPAIDRNLIWLLETLQNTRKKGMQYPLRNKKKNGLEALNKKPALTIGTIHSVKGGQADCVFISPDISMQASKGCNVSIAESDSLNRLFYVAVTRAREEVVIMEPATKYHFMF